MTTPLMTLATDSSELVHTIVWSVASEGLTVAVSVTVSPSRISAVVLSRVMAVTDVTFALTVISQVALTEGFDVDVTVIVALPAFSAVTVPPETEATEASELVHVTVLSVALSGDTVALRASVSPSVSVAVVLLMVMPVTAITFAFTVTSQVAALPPHDAMMVALPAFSAVTVPPETEATEASELVHVTVLSVALSGDTVALRASVSPSVSVAVVLLRVMPLTATVLLPSKVNLRKLPYGTLYDASSAHRYTATSVCVKMILRTTSNDHDLSAVLSLEYRQRWSRCANAVFADSK